MMKTVLAALTRMLPMTLPGDILGVKLTGLEDGVKQRGTPDGANFVSSCPAKPSKLTASNAPGDFPMKAIFCQIKCELTKAFDVAAYLVDNFPETAEVYSTSGTYDLLAKFELSDER